MFPLLLFFIERTFFLIFCASYFYMQNTIFPTVFLIILQQSYKYLYVDCTTVGLIANDMIHKHLFYLRTVVTANLDQIVGGNISSGEIEVSSILI